MLDVLIKNALIIPMTGRGIYMTGSIGVKGGRIAYVGSEASEAASVIDAGGRIVMPGLVNAHAHTAMCVMRGYADDYPLQTWLYEKVFPVEARLDERAIVAGAVLGMAEMIAAGTTSFSDMYFCQPAVAEEVNRIGMRANLCNAVLALGDDYEFEADRAVIETRGLIEKWGASGRVRADVAIHGEYTSSPAVWAKVSAWAREYGLVTQIHLAETKAECDGALERHGCTTAEAFYKHGILLAAHGVWLTGRDMALLAEKGVSVAHCPVSNLKLGSGIADAAAMQRAGVNVCLGTDGSCSNNSLDLFEEIKLAALLAKGTSLDPTAVDDYSALEMATVNGAKAQGREGEVGRIKEGYEADIIMLDSTAPHLQPVYDPVSTAVYSAKGSDVCMTMVAGRVLYQNGKWLSLDINKALDDVKKYSVPIVLNK